jgi:hypothetical protein
MDSGDRLDILPNGSAVLTDCANERKKEDMMKRKIKATYLAGRREDMGKYYYGETWTDENGEHFRVKFGKKIRTDRPWTFEEVKTRQFKKALKDGLEARGISRAWMDKHLVII